MIIKNFKRREKIKGRKMQNSKGKKFIKYKNEEGLRKSLGFN